jgi:hypothetical protein
MERTLRSIVPRARWLWLPVLTALVACAGTAIRPDSMPRDLGRPAPALAPAPAGEVPAGRARPENPFRQERPGLMTRAVFDTGEAAEAAEAAPAELTIEVRELLVGPRQSAIGFELGDAGAVLEVRTGVGVAVVAGERIELATGSTFALSAGQTIDLENTGEGALALRALVVHAR